MKFDNKTGKT